jgi:hypothetical protein
VYYGLLLVSLAGTGSLLQVNLSVGSLDATAYAVKSASGNLNLIVVNKDTAQAMELTIETDQNIQSATLQIMTGPSLGALSGVTIGGGTVNSDASFSPASPTVLTPVAHKRFAASQRRVSGY